MTAPTHAEVLHLYDNNPNTEIADKGEQLPIDILFTFGQRVEVDQFSYIAGGHNQVNTMWKIPKAQWKERMQRHEAHPWNHDTWKGLQSIDIQAAGTGDTSRSLLFDSREATRRRNCDTDDIDMEDEGNRAGTLHRL